MGSSQGDCMTHRDKPGYEYKTFKSKTETQINFKISQEQSMGWILTNKEESKRWPKGWTATMERNK